MVRASDPGGGHRGDRGSGGTRLGTQGNGQTEGRRSAIRGDPCSPGAQRLSTREGFAGFAGLHLRHLAKKQRLTVASRWLDTLKEESKHTTAALHEGKSSRSIGPTAKPKAPVNPPSKT